MKAEEYLSKIKKHDSQINNILDELEVLQALATRTTSVLGGERVQSAGSQDKMADCVADMADLRKQLNEEVTKYLEYRNKAKAVIDSACDAECNRLLYKRYFLFEKWEKIAVDMNYTYRWVSDGLHQRALAQVQKVLDGGSEDE